MANICNTTREDYRDSESPAAVAELRDYYRDREQRSGQPSYYHIVTYGCQMNENDSERLAGIMDSAGLLPTDEREQADVLLFNTCCVREHAESKLLGNVGTLEEWHSKHPGRILGICGCMTEEKGMAKRLMNRFPFIDFVLGTHKPSQLPLLMLKALREERTIQVGGGREVTEGVPVHAEKKHSGYISIMYGCDNYCSYCIVPYVRGHERSRRIEDVLDEAKRLADNGYTEITFLGQNVNSYRDGDGERNAFPELLRRADGIDGLRRIRFMTSHPKDISPELLHSMSEGKHICKQLHLPLQSGSDRLLELMNRRYTTEKYLSTVALARELMPEVGLSTDLIVGFPGETEEDFRATLDVYRLARFDAAFCFKYSKRTGTPAAEMENQIPEAVKKERLARLLTVQDEVALTNNQRYIGRTVEVLADSQAETKEGPVWQGRTESGILVSMQVEGCVPGSYVNAEISSVNAHMLYGKGIVTE